MNITSIIETPLFNLVLGVVCGIVGGDGIWSVVRLVRDAVVNRKAKRIQQKRGEEYGVMIEDVLCKGGEIIIRCKNRTIEIKSYENYLKI